MKLAKATARRLRPHHHLRHSSSTWAAARNAIPGGRRLIAMLLLRPAGRAALAMMLDDSRAGTVFLMFPRMRLRRVIALWLAAMITRAAFGSRPHARARSAASAGVR